MVRSAENRAQEKITTVPVYGLRCNWWLRLRLNVDDTDCELACLLYDEKKTMHDWRSFCVSAIRYVYVNLISSVGEEE